MIKRLPIPLLALVLLASCGILNPEGAYKGDKLLYTTDVTIRESYDLIHFYVKWEYDNRAALSSMPEIKASADAMRKNAPGWFRSVNALREAYVQAPNDINMAALQKAVAVLRAAIAEVGNYLTKASTIK